MEVILQGEPHDNTFSDKWINLASERLGTEVLFATDDFFAEKENLIKVGRGIFVVDKFTENGKWMDGWESRRKRTEGHDFADLRLGLPGAIRGIDIDTNHFTGNHPPYASIEACQLWDGNPDTKTEWTEILPKSPLGPGSQHLFEITNDKVWTHIRLHIYPDGGVARLRIYGDVKKNWDTASKDDELDLIAVENEGKAITCNDMYFSHKDNIIMPGRGKDMGDGWETKRKREPGNDWIILALGKRGNIKRMSVDTAHFKGNFPDSCSIESANLEVGRVDDITSDKIEWRPMLEQSKLKADHIHEFTELINNQKITHLRLNIYPDGGVSRLRAFGNLCD